MAHTVSASSMQPLTSFFAVDKIIYSQSPDFRIARSQHIEVIATNLDNFVAPRDRSI